MRTSKSTLAGVAAGALGLALVPFVSTTAAQAAGTVAGSNTPVRYTSSSLAWETSVPAAAIYWSPSDANVFSGTPTLTYTGTTSAGGSLRLMSDLTTEQSGGATLTLGGTDDTIVSSGSFQTLGDDSAIYVKVNAAGRYTGNIGNGSDTVTFDFTTAGAPTGITLTPATQDILVGATASVLVGLVDGSGNATQPTTGSTVAFAGSDTTNFTLTPASTTYSNNGGLFSLGALQLSDANTAAGSDTITATGGGDLLGMSATATVNASGGISDDTVIGMSVTSPASGVWNDSAALDNAVGPFNSQVKAGTTSLTVSIDDTDANTSGLPLRFKVQPSTGGSATVGGQTATNSTPIYVDATPSSGTATLAMTLGGASALAGGTVTVTQVDVNDAAIDGVSNLTITQVVPVVYASGVTVTPKGDVVAKLGDTTTVNVSVDDSLGDPASGQLVTAYRSSVSAANLLSFASTNADGSADVTVEGVSTLVDGDSENYVFTVSGYGASALPSPNTLTVTYTTDGKISTLSVAPGSATSVNAAGSTTVTTYGHITVPGTDGVVGNTASTGIYTIATDAFSGTASHVLAVPITTSPSNAATVTASEGVYVLDAVTATTSWSDGESSALISGGGTAYIYALETGTHTVTVESGGLSVTFTVVVTNSSNDAYNIALSPASQDVQAGSIGNVTLTVTDLFGNPVDTTDDTGAVTITASGEVLLAGFQPSASFSTDENGQATVTIIAGNAGTGTLAAGPKSGDAAPAWQTGYEAPTGAPAPVTSAAATVNVTSSSTKSITITGERGTVKGKPGIMVDGLTTGFAEGDLMVPWIKFPGQTSYSAGTARPAVDADGEFYWQRKTGKKIYVYFKNEDGSVKSDRIIIQAK